jgi:hypothetical protein
MSPGVFGAVEGALWRPVYWRARPNLRAAEPECGMWTISAYSDPSRPLSGRLTLPWQHRTRPRVRLLRSCAAVSPLSSSAPLEGLSVPREDVCKGTVDETTAHPREIFRPVIVHAAAGFVLVHNHPCGDASRSSADINLTRRVRKGARLLGLTFLDHVIVGQPMEGRLGYYSFREAGVV